jgi:hypothetical protein
MLTKPYPKDNEPRTGLPPDLVTQLAAHIDDHGLRSDDLLFATREGTPLSKHLPHTRIWRPAVVASGTEFGIRFTTSATLTRPGSSPAAPTSNR